MKCACGSNQEFNGCCEPLIEGTTFPETAEQLMRSRYTAYVHANIPYLKQSLTKKSQKDFDVKGAKAWAESVTWKGLRILSTELGGVHDKKGVVEFVVTYEQEGEAIDHHEISHFKRDEHGHWKFEDGEVHTHQAGEACEHAPKVQTFVREAPKVGRNDPCICGSGKKFKKCCG